MARGSMMYSEQIPPFWNFKLSYSNNGKKYLIYNFYLNLLVIFKIFGEKVKSTQNFLSLFSIKLPQILELLQ